MAKPKRFRWICPDCGAGKNASSRPRMDATVRFCLPCSEKTGTLVKRTCPALDKRRVTSAAKSATKAKKKKAKADAKWTRSGLDVRKEIARCAKAAKIFTPKVEIRDRTDGFDSGRSYGGRVVLSLCSGTKKVWGGTPAMEATPCMVRALVAHEIAHEALWREGHSQVWRNKFLDIVRKAYKVDCGDPGGSYHDLHAHVEQELRKAGK